MKTVLGILLCFCMAHHSAGFMAQIFGPNGLLGGRLGQIDSTNTTTTNVTAPPWICEDNPCLSYTVLEKTQAYELRHYERMTVVTAVASGRWMPNMVAFAKLSKYFRRGKNSEGVMMNMTFPVISPLNSTSYTAMAALSPGDSASPPAPISLGMRIDVLPAMDVFVKPFESGIFGSDPTQAVNQFKTSLGPSAPLAASGEAFVAEYNTPYAFVGRHGEIWLLADYPPASNATRTQAVDAPSFLPGEPTEYL